MVKNNYYSIRYHKIGKPNGTRTLTVGGLSTFETLIYRVLLDKISNSIYKTHFDTFMDGNIIFIKRVKAIGTSAEYLIRCNDFRNTKHLVDYKIFIECEEYNTKIDLFEQIYDEYEYTEPQVILDKIKKTSIRLQEERNVIKRFLLQLYFNKSLKNARKKMSKATYYRHIKHCIEQGYVVNDKLSKEVLSWIK
jgi:hypothetical protein